MGDLVLIGDAHIERDDPALPSFLEFLDGLSGVASRVVFLGDLFSLWLGRRELEQPHQTAVVDRLAALRRRGVRVRYLEGNRDYRIGACYAGGALDEATAGGLTERFGGHRLWAVHGDLANPADLRYRTWRRISRSAPVWALFNLIPRRRRLHLAASVERRLRASNREFKGGFPEAAVRTYAAGFLRAGHDLVVLGHFHVEKDLEVDLPGTRGRILVLPEWKASRRHLRVTEGGEVGFVDS